MNKKLLAIAISGALAVPMAAQAVSFKVGGHVNRAINFYDDGRGSDVTNVDNGTSGSRFRFTGSDDLGVGGMKVGMTIEAGMQSNLNFLATSKAANGSGGANDSALNIRHSFVWFSGGFGKLYIGHTSSAYDGTDGADLSGALFLSGHAASVVSTHGSSVQFRNGTTGGNVTSVGSTNSSFDGGREDVLRYDTPKFGPFSGKVSIGDNGMWDFQAKVAGAFSGAKYDLRGGYQEDSQSATATTPTTDKWNISGSLLFSQGTSLTGQYGELDNGARTSESFYLKLGHKWGNNAIGIDYRQTDDRAAANDEYTGWGVGFVHNIPGPRVQLYAGYRNHDLDRPGTNVEDVDIFNVGARVAF